jgi:hypothetical protein
MAADAQGGIFGAADGVVPDGDASPMEDGVGEASMTGIRAHDEATFAESLCNGSDACQGSHGVIGSPLQASVSSSDASSPDTTSWPAISSPPSVSPLLSCGGFNESRP